MASKKDDEGRPPTGSVQPPPPPRARPQIRPIGDKAAPPVPRALRAPISLPSASVRSGQKGPPVRVEAPMPRFPSLPAIEEDDDATRTQAPPPEFFQEPPPPRRAPAHTIRGNPGPVLGTKPAPAPAPPQKPVATQSRTAPAARIAAPAPRIAAPTPAPPRVSSPTPIPPRMPTATATPEAPVPPRTEARPAARDARPARPAIDVVPQTQRAPDERTVVMPAAPGRPAGAVAPPAQPVRAKFPAPREPAPKPQPTTARPPAPSVPSLGALIEPIAAPKPATQTNRPRAPSERPPTNRSPFVHTRTAPAQETQGLPSSPVARPTRTDRPAAQAPSVAPPRLHPPTFPPPPRAPSVAPPQLDDLAGHEHRDETLAMARPWPTPNAPRGMMHPAPPVQQMPPSMQPMQMPMTPQALPIMAHPGFAPSAPVAWAPSPALLAPPPPSPFGVVLFAAPLALATAALAAIALLF